MTDAVTLLSHGNLRLAKRWRADGVVEPYEDAKQYTLKSVPVADIQALSALLTSIERDPHTAVVRGAFRGVEIAKQDPEYEPGRVRRLAANFDDVPHHWCLIDIDKFKSTHDPVHEPEAAIAEMVGAILPEAFHDISYHWQLSNTAGHAKAAGLLKVHLWFWLRWPGTSAQVKAWAQAHHVAVDHALFNTVQLHYTAAPVFAPGVVDPVPRRSGFVQGFLGDEVILPLDAPVAASTTPSDSDSIEFMQSTLGWTLDDAREVLFDCNADAPRDTWLKDLAALHFETGGSDEGLALAIEWSSTAANFDSDKDVRERWRSFGAYRGGQSITGRWLLKRQKECTAHRKYDVVDRWKKKLQEPLEEYEIRERIVKEIAADTDLDDLGREQLAKALQDKLTRVTGTKFPIAEMRKLVAPPKRHVQRDELPEWLQGWVYVTEDDQFFRMDSAEWLSVQGFNACFNRECPRNADGDVLKNASVLALEDYGIDTVTKAVYLPWAKETFTLEGVRCVNTYRPSSAPQAVARMSEAGVRAASVIREHLEVISGDRPEVVRILLDWIAHNVQQPGVKIRWMPLIKGVEGDGKTFIGTLLAAVMGRANVKNVSPTVLGTNFTGWAHGAAVAVLEEIRITGHSRHDILNALKPYITNDSVEIHPKGKDPYDTVNTMNQIAFTNFVDALPLKDTDRRCMVIFTPFQNIDEMVDLLRGRLHLDSAVGAAEVQGAYFDRLADAIKSHRAELRRYFLDHTISASFRPNGRAPMTDEKKVMISAGVSDEEMAVQEALEKGGEGVTRDVFSSSCLTTLMQALDDAWQAPYGRALNALYAKVGFTRLSKKVWWRESSHVVWVRGHIQLEADEVRGILDRTVPEVDPLAEFL